MISTCKNRQPADVICMIMCNQHTHDGLYGYVYFFQERFDGPCTNTCINQYSMKPVAQVITITTASTAQTAKFQSHFSSDRKGMEFSKIPEIGPSLLSTMI